MTRQVNKMKTLNQKKKKKTTKETRDDSILHFFFFSFFSDSHIPHTCLFVCLSLCSIVVDHSRQCEIDRDWVSESNTKQKKRVSYSIQQTFEYMKKSIICLHMHGSCVCVYI